MLNFRQPPAPRRRLYSMGLLLATFLASTALTATAGYAQTATWIDNSAQTWDTPSGWDTNAEPDANTDVIIPPADQTNGGTNVRVSTTDAVARSIQINGGLSVYNGGVLVVGEDLTATGGNALMGINGDDGAGGFSTLTVNGQLNFDGGGNFSVYDGGILTTHGAILSGNGSTNPAALTNFAATVNNGGVFDNSGHEMTIGRAGNAYLYLYNNGTLLTDMLYLGREAATATSLGGDGLLLIGSNSSATVTNTIEVGGAGEGEVLVESGGQLNSVIGRVGDQQGGVGLVTVNGGAWTNTASLSVGLLGEGTVNIANGGALDTAGLTLGNNGSGVGMMTVSGSASSLDVAASAYIGQEGMGSLHILDGANAFIGTNTNNDLLIGYDVGGQGSVRVESGASLTGTGTLSLGSQGAGRMDVDAGTVDFWALSAGGSDGGTGDLVLSGGAAFNVTNNATFGYAGDATLNVSGASRFAATNLFVGLADVQSHGEVIASGANSEIDIAGQIELGGFGSGAMRIENGAKLSSDTFVAASDAGASGNLVLTGSGSVWSNSANAHFGVAGDASLTVLDQAQAQIASNLTVGNAAGAGTSTLAIANGQVNVAGDLTQYSNSTYSYVIGNGPTVGGLIVVNGMATIVDGAQLTIGFDGSVAVGDEFAVLNADGGVNGTYTLVNGGQISAFLGIDALYDPTTVTIVVTTSQDLVDVAATPNQITTAAGLQSLGSGNALYDTILNIATEDEARFAFDQLSGEVHASIKTALIEESGVIRDAAIERIRAGFDDVVAAPTTVLAYGPGGPEVSVPDIDLFTVWGHLLVRHANIVEQVIAEGRQLAGLLLQIAAPTTSLHVTGQTSDDAHWASPAVECCGLLLEGRRFKRMSFAPACGPGSAKSAGISTPSLRGRGHSLPRRLFAGSRDVPGHSPASCAAASFECRRCGHHPDGAGQKPVRRAGCGLESCRGDARRLRESRIPSR